jgi:hypothetical protein
VKAITEPNAIPTQSGEAIQATTRNNKMRSTVRAVRRPRRVSGAAGDVTSFGSSISLKVNPVGD